MKAINGIGGALLVAGLAVAVILGLQTPTGRAFWDGIWQAASTVVGYFADQVARLDGTAVAGNVVAAAGLAALGLVILLILLPKPISIRLFTVTLVLATLAAFVLYQPSVVSGLGS